MLPVAPPPRPAAAPPAIGALLDPGSQTTGRPMLCSRRPSGVSITCQARQPTSGSTKSGATITEPEPAQGAFAAQAQARGREPAA